VQIWKLLGSKNKECSQKVLGCMCCMKVITYYYHYVEDRENPAMKAFSSNSDPRQPSQLPYWPTENYDPWSEYRNKPEESKEKEEIYEAFKGDIAD
jgi:hypothetical protein